MTPRVARTVKDGSRLLVLAGLAAALLVVPAAAPAHGHAGNKLELFLERLEFHPIDGTTWRVHLGLIDSDSGSPASGFDARISAVGPAGQSVGTVALDDHGDGEYYGKLAVAAGTWSFTVLAKEIPDGEPAVTLRKSMSVTLQPGVHVAAGSTEAARHVQDKAQQTTEAGGDSGLPRVLALVGGVTAAGAAGVAMRRHRRRRHPSLAQATIPR